ncbi:MAG: hypothetical protein ABIQ51_20035 [Mesorhizobium sp.]
MGVFDQHIEWLRGRKAEAEQDLEDYVAGAQYLIGGMDYTQSFVARTQSDILRFEALIATCNERND